MGIWLSWSSFKQYETCGKQYNYQRVKKKDPPEKDSKHNAIIGSVVQRVYEDFYNDELWRKGSDTSDELMERTEKYYYEFLEEEYVDFNDVTCRFDSKTEPLKECYDIVPKVLEGIKREQFLGPYAKSEEKLKERFGSDFLFGYVDFIIRNQDDELILLDGKSSKHREKYVDERQLYFYALLFYLRYKRLPDKLGFFYYRFADDPEKAVDWIPVHRKKVKQLKMQIEDVLSGIHDYNFPAKPKYSHCQWCPYEIICKERQEQKKANRAKRQKNSKKPKLEADFDGDGPTEIGFNNLKN